MQYWFITGTSSGLGRAIAEAVLQKNDVKVFGFSRHKEITHTNYFHSDIDLSDPEQVKKIIFDECLEAEKIVLINNAGSLGKIDQTKNLDLDTIIRTYQLNIISPHILISKFIKQYENYICKKIIINISSGAASSPYDGWSMYCSSKAALNMLTLCVSKELELNNSNIKILSVAPGVMDTEMQTQIRNVDEGAFSRKNKFVDLKNNDQLYNAHDVAAKFIEMIDNVSASTETILKIEL